MNETRPIMDSAAEVLARAALRLELHAFLEDRRYAWLAIVREAGGPTASDVVRELLAAPATAAQLASMTARVLAFTEKHAVWISELNRQLGRS